MGGHLLELESTKIMHEGMRKGISQGLSQGLSQGEIIGSVKTMREFEVPEDQIAEKIIKNYNLTPEQANIYLAETTTAYNKQ